MVSKNKNLHQANKAKKDEFYTQMTDIEKELRHYKSHFENKVVFCNCDDPEYSNFWEFFRLKFNSFKLRKLIATHYQEKGISYKLELIREINAEGVEEIKQIKTSLKGNGDFRSDECIELLKESDIVVTNPPFSLFREYVAQLMQYNKKFLIIGNQNAITYKEIFPLIQNNELWLGYGFEGGAAHFINKHYVDYATSSNHKEGMIRVSGVVWFTNLEIKKRHENLILYKTYTAEEYPKYDNYDAINVNKTKEIPLDYDGVMGVPITFLNKYNPEQFEIIRFRKGDDNKDLSINGKCPYFRILIRKKQKED